LSVVLLTVMRRPMPIGKRSKRKKPSLEAVRSPLVNAAFWNEYYLVQAAWRQVNYTVSR